MNLNPKTCNRCGEQYEPASGKQKFCQRCIPEAIREARKRRRQAYSPLREKTCELCERQYMPGHPKQKFCRECRQPNWHHPPKLFLNPEELKAVQDDPRKVWTIRGPNFIACDICGQLAKALDLHLRHEHKRMTCEEYKARTGPDGVKPRYNRTASLCSKNFQAKLSRRAKDRRLYRLGAPYGHPGWSMPTGGARVMSLQHDLNVGDAGRGKSRPDLWKRTPRGDVVTDERIARLRLQGKTQPEIASDVGVTRAAVDWRLRRMGFPPKVCVYEHGQPVSGEHVANLIEDYHKTAQEIAKRLHVSPNWVSLHRWRQRGRTLSVRMARRVVAVDQTLLRLYRIESRGGRPRKLPPSKLRSVVEGYKALLLDLQTLRRWLHDDQDSRKLTRSRIWEWLCERSRAEHMRTLFFWPQFFDWVKREYETKAFVDGDWAPHEITAVFLADSFNVTDDVIRGLLTHRMKSSATSSTRI